MNDLFYILEVLLGLSGLIHAINGSKRTWYIVRVLLSPLPREVGKILLIFDKENLKHQEVVLVLKELPDSKASSTPDFLPYPSPALGLLSTLTFNGLRWTRHLPAPSATSVDK